MKSKIEDNLVYKSNDLVEASYSLSVNEQRVLLSCISQVDSREAITADTPFKVTIGQVQDLFYRKDSKAAYECFKVASKKLRDRGFTIKEDGEDVYTSFVQTARFNSKEQSVTLYFSTGIIPHITNLRANFTKYRLGKTAHLTSSYAIRIYELIVSWYAQSQSYKELDIDDFKNLLQIADKYKQIGQFKDRVISPALEQINENTDFNLEVSYRKVGRSFKYIQLRFNQKPEHRMTAESRSNRAKHNLTQTEQKKQALKKQRLKVEFEEFAKNTSIKEGMIFENAKTGTVYTVDENLSIMTNDFKDVNKYFIAEEHIKKLIFTNRLKQITNPEDSNTKSLL